MPNPALPARQTRAKSMQCCRKRGSSAKSQRILVCESLPELGKALHGFRGFLPPKTYRDPRSSLSVAAFTPRGWTPLPAGTEATQVGVSQSACPPDPLPFRVPCRALRDLRQLLLGQRGCAAVFVLYFEHPEDRALVHATRP